MSQTAENSQASNLHLIGTHEQEDFWDKLISVYSKYLGNKNPIVLLGVLILLFATAFILKYASSKGLLNFSIEARAIAATAFGFAMIMFGKASYKTRPAFGASLEGGGLGVIYITAFAAYKLYELLPGLAAFSIFIILTIAGATLAVSQNSLALAVLASLGGFLAPVLNRRNRAFQPLCSLWILFNFKPCYLFLLSKTQLAPIK